MTGADFHAAVEAVFRANLAGALRMQVQHSPDESGRCPLCRTRPGCSLYAIASKVLREDSEQGD